MYDYSTSSEYKLIFGMKIVLPFYGPKKTFVSIQKKSKIPLKLRIFKGSFEKSFSWHQSLIKWSVDNK